MHGTLAYQLLKNVSVLTLEYMALDNLQYNEKDAAAGTRFTSIPPSVHLSFNGWWVFGELRFFYAA